jgi:phage-related holin
MIKSIIILYHVIDKIILKYNNNDKITHYFYLIKEMLLLW